MLMYQQYGEIFRLDLVGKLKHTIAWSWADFEHAVGNLGRKVVVISSYNLLHEVCDDKRFSKAVIAHLKEIAGLVHDGLFTCVSHIKPWWCQLSLSVTEHRHRIRTGASLVRSTCG